MDCCQRFPVQPLTAEDWDAIERERKANRLWRIEEKLPSNLGLLDFTAYRELREALSVKDIDAAWAAYDRLRARI